MARKPCYTKSKNVGQPQHEMVGFVLSNGYTKSKNVGQPQLIQSEARQTTLLYQIKKRRPTATRYFIGDLERVLYQIKKRRPTATAKLLLKSYDASMA